MAKLTPLLLVPLTGLAPACGGGAIEPGAASAAAPAPVAPDSGPELVELTCGEIPNLHAKGDFWFAGQPSPEDLAEARAQGVETVLNLRHAAETPDLDQQAAAEEAGLAYVALPWNGDEELTDEVFERAREVLREEERPLLVYCGSANRVGAVWIPYRVLDEGASLDQAIAEAREIGLRTDAYVAKARDYVDRTRAAPR